MTKPVASGEMWKVYFGIATLPKLSGSDKAVLAVLVDHANADGKAWPSFTTIAARLKLPVRCVKRSVANLIDTPYVKRQRRRRTSNVYQIDFEKVVTDAAPQKVLRGDRNDTHGVTDAAPQGVTDAAHKQEQVNRNKEQDGARKRATPVPSDWHPSNDTIAVVEKMGFDEGTIETQVAKFIDHSHATGKKFIDHDAAFRNWMRDELRFTAERRAKSNGGDSWSDCINHPDNDDGLHISLAGVAGGYLQEIN